MTCGASKAETIGKYKLLYKTIWVKEDWYESWACSVTHWEGIVLFCSALRYWSNALSYGLYYYDCYSVKTVGISVNWFHMSVPMLLPFSIIFLFFYSSLGILISPYIISSWNYLPSTLAKNTLLPQNLVWLQHNLLTISSFNDDIYT